MHALRYNSAACYLSRCLQLPFSGIAALVQFMQSIYAAIVIQCIKHKFSVVNDNATLVF